MTPSESENPIHVEQAGAITVVRFTCSALGAELAEGIGRELYRLAGASPEPGERRGLAPPSGRPCLMVVNLRQVSLMSSRMLAKLMALSRWVWEQAGGRLVLCNIDPSIREAVNRESAQLAQADRTLTDRLIFWRDTPPPGTAVDAAAEQQRLRENAALGKPATEGETPVIQRKSKGMLEGMFDGIF